MVRRPNHPAGTDDRPVVETLIKLAGADDLDGSRRAVAALPPRLVSALTAAARAHGLEAWLAACVPAGADVFAEVAAQRPRFLAAGTRALQDVRQLGERFESAAVPWAVLKGLAIARTAYPRADLRHSVDVDLLVSPARFEAVVSELCAVGYRLLDENWPLIAAEMPGELRLRSPAGTVIDLHWHLLNQRGLREEFRLPTMPALRRSRLLPGEPIRVLSLPDQLLHIALHAALGGANRLMWLVDLDRVIATAPPDWPAVAQRVRESRTGLPVAVALARARRALGTPAPDADLHRLGPVRGWLRGERAIESLSPAITADPARPAMSIAFARSSRATPGRSWCEFARHGWGWLRSGAPRTRRFGRWIDPDSESSSLHPVRDDSARARYFAAVSTAG